MSALLLNRKKYEVNEIKNGLNSYITSGLISFHVENCDLLLPCCLHDMHFPSGKCLLLLLQS